MDSVEQDGFKERIAYIARLMGNATELARKTGISRRAIGTYLAGSSDPTRERLVCIARSSGVCIEWLATGDGPVFNGKQHFDGKAIRLMPADALKEREHAFVCVPQAIVRPRANDDAFEIPALESCKLAFEREWLHQLGVRNEALLKVLVLPAAYDKALCIGDMVLIEKGVPPDQPGTYLIGKTGQYVIRRLEAESEGGWLWLGGGERRPVTRTELQKTGSLGKVLWTACRL